MTLLPSRPSPKKLGLVIDLDVCVGCHACVVSCKEWNTGGYGAALSDQHPYGADVSGAWLNRVHSSRSCRRAARSSARRARRASCISRNPACIATTRPASPSARPAPPTSASADGIVLVDEDKCIGCGLCAWACPYGAREMDLAAGVMKKCTLCIDRIYNETLRRGRPRAVLRAHLPGQCPPFRRSRRSRRRPSRSWSPSAAAWT